MSSGMCRELVRCAVERRCDLRSVASVFREGTRVSGELAELLFQGAALLVSRGLQIGEGDGLGGAFGGDRTAEECVVVEDSYLPEVTWVIPHRDVFPDVRGEDRGDVSGRCETDPVALHTAGRRCGE